MINHRHFLTFLFLGFLIFSNLFAQNPFEILISNNGGNSVKRFDDSGNFLGDFVQPNSGGLSSPQDVFILPDGSLLVPGINNPSVKRYSGSNGAYLGNFTTGFALSGPTKITMGPDSLLYITQWSTPQNEVVRFNLDGSYHSKFTSGGPTRALGQVWDANGNLYVAIFGITGDGVVRKFDSAGNDLGDFINSSILQGPTGIWWDWNGDMLVQDWNATNVLRYDNMGNYIGVFTTTVGKSEGAVVLEDKSILMPDWVADGIHRVDSAGNYLGVFASGNGLTDPNWITKRPALVNGLKPLTKNISTLSVYPSSAESLKTIEFSMEKSGPIDIRVISPRGKTQTLYTFSKLGEGFHQLEWNTMGLSPGIYLVHLLQNSESQSKKFIIIK